MLRSFVVFEFLAKAAGYRAEGLTVIGVLMGTIVCVDLRALHWRNVFAASISAPLALATATGAFVFPSAEFAEDHGFIPPEPLPVDHAGSLVASLAASIASAKR